MRPGFWLILISLLPSALFAQPAAPPLQVGVGMMGISYLGDLTNEDTYLRRIHPGGSISIQFAGKAFLQPQFNVGFGKFTEQNDLRTLNSTTEATPNTFVETSLFFTDLNLRGRFLRKRAIQPVIGLGLGLVFFNPKDQEGNYLGENIFTRLPNEQYNTTVPSFSGMAGVVGRLNSILSMSLEYTFRYVNSDYLDNIGQLGSRSGNDRLQHIKVGLLLTLRPKKVLPAPVSPPEETPPVISMAAVPDTGATTPAVKKDLTLQQINPLPGTTAPNLSPLKAQLVGKDWLAIEKAALLQKKFVYYPIRANDDLDFLVLYFHVRRQTIRQLNFLVNEEIEAGTILRLPDMGIPFP